MWQDVLFYVMETFDIFNHLQYSTIKNYFQKKQIDVGFRIEKWS
jgi:hypothetical protein